jgi:hypothetical protein
MAKISTSAKPLPFYADGEAPLYVLVDKFGSQLEQLDRRSKFLLLSSIALCAAVDASDYPLEEAFSDLPFDEMNEELQAMLPQLNTLNGDNLLGLCEALVAQLRYTREVK